MSTKTKGFFKKLLGSVLSAACVLSGTTVATTVASTAALNAAAADDNPPFSWDNASVYFLLTDRFYNGDTSNDHSYGRGLGQGGASISYDTLGAFQGGDFAGITKKINEGYFTELGVNAIWLSAPYEQIHGWCVGGDGDSFAHYSYHGYYVLDYTEADKNFGTKAEFKTLVDTAHEHGIRIVMDIVMNHAGYQTLKDMSEFGFGPLKSGWESYYYSHQNVNNGDYHGYIDYDGSNAATEWAKWWGKDWIRCGLAGYTPGGNSDIDKCLASLPDFKTGDSNNTSLPQVLQTKWGKEGTLAAKQAKYSSDNVSGYISTWLAEWVSEFGVDGFRCDTAKHVEISAWKKLKDKCVAALKQWRQNNPSAPGASWTDDFWMTGECWGHKVGKSEYFTSGAFDSMINFEFAPDVNNSAIPAAGSVENFYSSYATQINNDPQLNALTYLASHDTTLIKGDRKFAGSFLLMCPGGIQIYYGDETSRDYDNNPKALKDPGAGHQFRKFMNWDSMDTATLNHWQKVGQFRNNHLSVGAGAHKLISAYSGDDGYTFARTYSKGDIDDKVVVTLFAGANKDLTIDVSSVFAEGTEITNFYDDTTCKVSGGKVTFNTGANGTLLLQEPTGKKGRVVVTHINKDTGATIKTETLSGLLGESYTAQALSTEGYTVANVSGNKTGTFSETEQQVTFYYTFDANNYAYIVSKFVDASSGEELAESEQITKKIGTTYSVSPKDIKNYEVDLTKTNNASGTVAKGTTTVTFKYNYVKPTNLIVHYYNANGWSTVNIYAYDESGSTVKKFTGEWPGKAMTPEGDGWFVCDIPETESAQVIFNNGSKEQDPPGVGSPGYQCSGEVWLKNGKIVTQGKVKVVYQSTDGTVLGTATLTGAADGTTTYTTTAKEFAGYTLASTPANATGLFTSETITVTYTYNPTHQDLVNNTEINKTSINEGESVTISNAASGGTAPYTYGIYYKLSTASSYTTKQNFTSTASVSLKLTDKGTYSIVSKVKDSTGEIARKEFTVIVIGDNSLANNSTISATKINLGETLTVTGKASGGTKPYKYAFYYKKDTDSKYVTKSDFSTTSTVTIKPQAAVKYNVVVKVKDGKTNIARKQFNVTVNPAPLTNKSTLSATTTTVKTPITVKCAAAGGTAPYTYAVYYKQATQTSYTKVQDYSSTATVKVTPQNATKYVVLVKAKDKNRKVSELTLNFTAKPAALANNSTISATSIKLGSTLTVTGKATGGSSPYKYAFYYKKASDSSYVTKSDFGKATSVSIKPAAATKYSVVVKVKDANKTIARKEFTVSVSNPLTNNSKISATTISKGDTITVTGAATGGTSPYKYAFYYKKASDSSYVTKSDFGKATKITLKPNTATKYSIVVKVKDAKKTIARKEFTVTVKNPFTNTSKLSATSVALGNTITATASATGGTTPYTYAFYYKKDSDTKWVTVKDYSTANTATIKPQAATKYNVVIKVKDKTGAIARKEFAVNVTSPLTNKSKVSATSVSKGATVTLTGAATGGTTPYQYAFYYKKSADSSYTLIQAYSTTTTAKVTLSAATKYNVIIRVKDKAGTVESKTFTITAT